MRPLMMKVPMLFNAFHVYILFCYYYCNNLCNILCHLQKCESMFTASNIQVWCLRKHDLQLVPVSISWCGGNSQCLIVRSVTIVHGFVWNNHNNYKQWWLFINIRIWFYIKMLRFTEYQESVSSPSLLVISTIYNNFIYCHFVTDRLQFYCQIIKGLV